MRLPPALARILIDPPPPLAFELSEAGIAVARSTRRMEIDFQPLKPGVLSASPMHDNVLQQEEFTNAVRSATPQAGQRKRRDVAVVLPDFCARTAVLDFDNFPGD